MLLYHSEAFNTVAYFALTPRNNYIGIKHLFTATAAPQPGCELAQLFQFFKSHRPIRNRPTRNNYRM